MSVARRRHRLARRARTSMNNWQPRDAASIGAANLRRKRSRRSSRIPTFMPTLRGGRDAPDRRRRSPGASCSAAPASARARHATSRRGIGLWQWWRLALVSSNAQSRPSPYRLAAVTLTPTRRIGRLAVSRRAEGASRSDVDLDDGRRLGRRDRGNSRLLAAGGFVLVAVVKQDERKGKRG